MMDQIVLDLDPQKVIYFWRVWIMERRSVSNLTWKIVFLPLELPLV